VRRFIGSHTYLTIAEKLTSIFEDFEVPIKKIVRITTDNASNFAKAFNVFTECGLDLEDDVNEGSDNEKTDDSGEYTLSHSRYIN
jgi:hypothetical protein